MGTESLLILDEPLSSLDPERRNLLMGFIERANLAVCEKWISARPLPIIRGVHRQ